MERLTTLFVIILLFLYCFGHNVDFGQGVLQKNSFLGNERSGSRRTKMGRRLNDDKTNGQKAKLGDVYIAESVFVGPPVPVSTKSPNLEGTWIEPEEQRVRRLLLANYLPWDLYGYGG